MKHYIFISTLIFISFFAKSQLVVDQKSHDFGILSNWSENPAIFEIRNDYSSEIAILTLKKSEGVKVKYPTGYIQPGQRDTILIYYEPINLGKFNEKIEIYTSADPKPLELYISGKVISYLECPSAIQTNDPAKLIYIHQGIVVDQETQLPVEDAEVIFLNQKNTKIDFKTPKDGRFKKKFEIGLYNVFVEAKGYKPYDQEIYLNKNTPFIVLEIKPIRMSEIAENNEIVEDNNVVIEKTSNEEVEEEVFDESEIIEINENPTTTISTNPIDKPFLQQGTITNPNGTPLGKAVVKFTDVETNIVYTYKTMTNGKFQKTLNPGIYQLEISLTGYEPFIKKVDISNPDSILNIELIPLDKTITENETVKEPIVQTGKIIDKTTGLPINRAYIVFANLNTGTPYEYKTFEDGYFKKIIKPGPYKITVTATGYEPLTIERGLLTNDELNIELIPIDNIVINQSLKNISVEGKIVAPQNIPINKAVINFYNPDLKTSYTYKTFSDGKFRKMIKPGNYQLTINAPGFETLTKDIELLNPIDNLNFELNQLMLVNETKIEAKEEFEQKIEKIKKEYEQKTADSLTDIGEKIRTNEIESNIGNPTTTNPNMSLLPVSSYSANNIVFLIDVSSSMKYGHKLENLKYSMTHLTDILRDIDLISILTYNTEPTTVINAIPADLKDSINQVIDSLTASGFTYGLKGLNMAYEVAEQNFIDGGNNEVIIATDGEFNSPDYSEVQMIAMINKYASKGIILTVIGYGKNEKALRKMNRMASVGKGSFLHITNKASAQSILIDEIKLNSQIK